MRNYFILHLISSHPKMWGRTFLGEIAEIPSG